MTLLDMKEIIRERLNQLSVHMWDSSQSQVTCRCPYCGDSHNKTHGHFSIKVDRSSDSIMLYRCFKCNATGILTSKTMDDLGAFLSEEEAKALDNLNRPSGKSTYGRQRPQIYKVPIEINPVDSRPKIEYVESRLGIQLTQDRIQESKIVLSIMDFFNENHIQIPSHLNPKFVKLIEENYVGFLSSNNNTITFRRVTENENLKRYLKVTMDPQNTSPNNFYAMQSSGIDLLYTQPVHIHITEGTFDILSVRYNLPHNEDELNFYYACCGYSFNVIIKWLIYVGVNTHLCVHIYSDNDKTDRENLKLLNDPLDQVWIEHLWIHRNRFPGEKDFGVPLERIQESHVKIK